MKSYRENPDSEECQRASRDNARAVFAAQHPAPEPVRLDVTIRHYGDTYIARCNGCQASCTSSAATAALSAAKKHFVKLCAQNYWDEEAFKVAIAPVGTVLYSVTFTP